MEYFAAVAHEILQFTFLIQVQVLFMLLVVRVTLELAVAQFALDRILSGVHVHVFDQLLLGDERFITVVARVRLDFHVTFLVQHVAGSGVEFFATRHALVRMHFLDMLLVLVSRGETYETGGADARSFADTVQPFQMLQQGDRRVKMFVADTTHHVTRIVYVLVVLLLRMLFRFHTLSFTLDTLPEQRLDSEAILLGVHFGDMTLTQFPRIELDAAIEADKFALNGFLLAAATTAAAATIENERKKTFLEICREKR